MREVIGGEGGRDPSPTSQVWHTSQSINGPHLSVLVQTWSWASCSFTASHVCEACVSPCESRNDGRQPVFPLSVPALNLSNARSLASPLIPSCHHSRPCHSKFCFVFFRHSALYWKGVSSEIALCFRAETGDFKHASQGHFWRHMISCPAPDCVLFLYEELHVRAPCKSDDIVWTLKLSGQTSQPWCLFFFFIAL